MVRGGARAQRSSSGWRTRAPIHTLIETYHRRRAPPHPTGAICTVLTESGARSFRPANNLLQPSKGNPPLFNASEGVRASERNAQQYNNPNQILTPHRDGGELAEAMHWRCSRAIVLLKHRSRSSCPATLFAASTQITCVVLPLPCQIRSFHHRAIYHVHMQFVYLCIKSDTFQVHVCCAERSCPLVDLLLRFFPREISHSHCSLISNQAIY